MLVKNSKRVGALIYLKISFLLSRLLHTVCSSFIISALSISEANLYNVRFLTSVISIWLTVSI